MNSRKNRVHPHHPEHTGAHDHDDGGHHGFAQPAGGRNGAVHKGGDAVGHGHHAHPLHACGDDGGFRGEQRQEFPAEQPQGAAQHQPHPEGVGQADEVALFHPVGLAGTVVLAHKAGTGHVKRRHGVVDQRIGVGCRRVALHHQRVKAVHADLNKQVRNGKNGVLETRRETQHENSPGHVRVKADLPQVQRVAVLHAGQGAQDQPRRHTLCNGAGQGHTSHVQLAHDHEKQVQQNVQHAREREVAQGLLGFANGAEYRIAVVVQRQRRHAQKVHPQVQNGPGQQVLFGVQQPQQRRRAEQPHRQQ